MSCPAGQAGSRGKRATGTFSNTASVQIPLEIKKEQLILTDELLFFWRRRRDLLAFPFALRGTAKGNKGIRQCLHWLMHMPSACADMIQIPPPAYTQKDKTPTIGGGPILGAEGGI